MTMRRAILYISIIIGLFTSINTSAQEDVQVPYTDEYLDTVNVSKVFVLNDYVTVGFESGVSFNRMRFNPAFSQSVRLSPEYYELTFTKYGKMFGYMPYFGLKVGIAYGHEAYKFKPNRETGYVTTIEGAEEAVYDYIELPLMSHFHFDATHFKITADLGPYAAYRTAIERYGFLVDDSLRNSFKDTDIRFEHGLKGGLGMALVFSPVEVFINGKVRYSWTSLYQPDYADKYSYRFAYPFDIIVSAGVQFQITKRTGKTKAMLRQQARQIVYGEE